MINTAEYKLSSALYDLYLQDIYPILSRLLLILLTLAYGTHYTGIS